jgi:site-specific DNA-methyltransferase (adenine-specific)
VLDPFAGSGTTAKAAKDLGRNSVSYEINSDFIPLIEDTIGGLDLFDELQVIYSPEFPTIEQLNAKILNLPYKFVDVHKFNKKVDIKKLNYGSKIDMGDIKYGGGG